jgi:hypothetical protein
MILSRSLGAGINLALVGYKFSVGRELKREQESGRSVRIAHSGAGPNVTKSDEGWAALLKFSVACEAYAC